MAKPIRYLHEDFKKALKEGFLKPLLDHVKKDNTLCLFIRENYIDIYYRGTKFLNLAYKPRGRHYNIGTFPTVSSTEPVYINNENEAKQVIIERINTFPILKQQIDENLTEHRRTEREAQQLLVWENNYSRISDDTEYFVIDIEMDARYIGIHGKFDIIACKWPKTSKDRKNDIVDLAIIEMKYGDNALSDNEDDDLPKNNKKTKSGLIKHLKDMEAFLSNPDNNLRETAQYQLNLLNELGLLKHKKTNRTFKISKEIPEVIFLLANFKPNSNKLPTILGNLKLQEIIERNKEKNFNVRLFTACAAGYGMYINCMKNIDEFRKMHFPDDVKDNNITLVNTTK